MKWVTTHDRTLQIQEKRSDMPAAEATGFSESITLQSVHELLFDPAVGRVPLFPALMIVRAAMDKGVSQKGSQAASRPLIWIDPAQTFYPPGLLVGKMSLGQLDILRPGPADLTWATVECLRCKHVGAVVSLMMHRPTRVEVRRLQLAAEQGGGVGVLLRPNRPNLGSDIYAASTRWLVSPAPGERTIQRWRIQQIHGQGRRNQSSFLLEKHRASGQTLFVYPSAPVVDHPILSSAS